jgi:hypothetical protein
MRYSLKLRDWLKAAIMAIGAPVLTFLLDSLNAENFVFNWGKLATVAASAGIVYILKNFFTDDMVVAQKVIEEKIAATKEEAPLSSAGPGGSTLPPPGGLPPKP